MTKQEMLDQFDPNDEYDLYYHKNQILMIMQDYADQETSALRAENERLRGLIKQMWYEEVGKYFDNISEKDHWYEQFKTEKNL